MHTRDDIRLLSVFTRVVPSERLEVESPGARGPYTNPIASLDYSWTNNKSRRVIPSTSSRSYKYLDDGIIHPFHPFFPSHHQLDKPQYAPLFQYSPSFPLGSDALCASSSKRCDSPHASSSPSCRPGPPSRARSRHRSTRDHSVARRAQCFAQAQIHSP